MTGRTPIAQALVDYYEEEMSERAHRALPPEREQHLHAFAAHLRDVAAHTVLEVGCGAGRDAVVLAEAVDRYVGVDLTPAAVRMCQDLGLEAHEASATDLPFPDTSFDAGWSMSTLMHLTDDEFDGALGELRRVMKPGGAYVAIGIWGADEATASQHEGRFFNRRTDDDLRRRLARLGDVEVFETWGASDLGFHYQFARIRT